MATGYQSGFYAPSRGGIAKYPSLWKGCVMAFMPCLGNTGLIIPDLTSMSSGVSLSFASSPWGLNNERMSLGFQADADYVDAGASMRRLNGAKHLSVSMWVNLTSVANTGTGRRWVGKWGSAGQSSWLVSQKDSAGGVLLFAAYDGSSYTVQETSSSVLTTGLHHVCVTSSADGSNTRIYIDGVSQAISSVVSSATVFQSTTTAVRIGADLAAANGIRGYLFDAMVYDYIIPQSQIELLRRRPCIAAELADKIVYLGETSGSSSTIMLFDDVLSGGFQSLKSGVM